MVILSLFSCADQPERLLPKSVSKKPEKENCVLESIYRGGEHGFGYSFEYNKENRMTRIFEFADFDSISYVNNLPFKAINTNNSLYQILFEYNNAKLLSGVKFEGKDGQGRPFSYFTKYTTNTLNQITRVELSLSTFETPFIANITYDKKGNILKITSPNNGREITLVENLQFDDKSNPFAETYSDKILMYFIIYSAATGGNNLTFFVNKNNLIKSRINTPDGVVETKFEYEYSKDGLPLKSQINHNGGRMTEKSEETYTYKCQ
ncbi:MAG: hypothetical protein MUF45_00685 [Spirosomaceae bacterium]|nr:hypothetical protein [Spirosomataceae bacterium]